MSIHITYGTNDIDNALIDLIWVTHDWSNSNVTFRTWYFRAMLSWQELALGRSRQSTCSLTKYELERKKAWKSEMDQKECKIYVSRSIMLTHKVMPFWKDSFYRCEVSIYNFCTLCNFRHSSTQGSKSANFEQTQLFTFNCEFVIVWATSFSSRMPQICRAFVVLPSNVALY